MSVQSVHLASIFRKLDSIGTIYCFDKNRRFQWRVQTVQAHSLRSLSKLLCGSHTEDIFRQGSAPMSVDVRDGEVAGETTHRYDLSARGVAGAATCRVAADIRTTAGVYSRHVASASREATILAAPQTKRTFEFLAEFT